MKKKPKRYIGVDIGGTKMLCALVSPSGKILARRKIATPANARPGQITKLIIQMIRETKNERPGRIRGIGLGVPGIVAPNGRDIHRTPNINLSRYPLHKKLKDAFHVPVVLGNDVNCGLLGEKWLGAGRDGHNIIGLFPGTGVGGAIIMGGQIVTGAQGAAGELGHMIIDYNSRVSHAGVAGSLEALASRQAIERRIRKGVRRGRKTVLKKILNGRISVIKSKAINKALRRHDPLVTKIIDEVCEIFGKACISLRHIFNPDTIIFGGGLIEACHEYMLPRIRHISHEDPFFRGIDHCRILPSCLGDDAVIAGAVKMLIDREKRR